jgi:hypothetical protein
MLVTTYTISVSQPERQQSTSFFASFLSTVPSFIPLYLYLILYFSFLFLPFILPLSDFCQTILLCQTYAISGQLATSGPRDVADWPKYGLHSWLIQFPVVSSDLPFEYLSITALYS